MKVSTRPAAIEATEISAGYGPLPVVSGVSIRVDPGQVVGLLGANGAGKTTTLLALGGELPLRSGTVRIGGDSATGPLFERVRRGLAFVTEERSVFMNLTVKDNLALGRGPTEKALELMPELNDLMARRAGLLSGGEQQMLTLARALASSPKVLLADELSLGLAPLIVNRLLTAVRTAANGGAGILLVEQHAKKALHVCDRAYVMQRGQIVLEGDASELLERLDEIEATYLSTAAADSNSSSASTGDSGPDVPEGGVPR